MELEEAEVILDLVVLGAVSMADVALKSNMVVSDRFPVSAAEAGVRQKAVAGNSVFVHHSGTLG